MDEEEDDQPYKPPVPTPRSTKIGEDLMNCTRGLSKRQEKIIGRHSLLPKQLKTGFGIHTDRSLELAIKASQPPPHICKCVQCHPSSYEGYESTESADYDSIVTDSSSAEDQLKFLMGLSDKGEEEGEKEDEGGVVEEEVEDFISGETEAMRGAQRYLREHRIFEFYQFLIAQLLSANAFDPINFLINLLDKCLIYRSGMAQPPLLYNRKHIGMNTLGIKSYDPNPPIVNGMIPKNFFIEEAHECLKDLLNDMIRKRRKQKFRGKKMPKAPPPSTNCSVVDFNKTNSNEHKKIEKKLRIQI